MADAILSLAAKYTLPSKAKAEGTFTLTSSQLVWEPDELGAADSVLVSIKDISGKLGLSPRSELAGKRYTS